MIRAPHTHRSSAQALREPPRVPRDSSTPRSPAGGELPVRRKGMVIGAIGTSAGTVEQDVEVAEAAIGAIEPSIQSTPVGVPSC
jgi:uncharacterized protein GlcG (DUF336 family)